MSGRNARPDTTPELTSSLRNHLKAYTGYILTVDSSLKDANQIQSELDQDGKPLPLVKLRLERQLELVGEHATEEMKRIDHALETIDRLLALDKQFQQEALAQSTVQPIEIPVELPEPSKRGTKKRRLDSGSSAVASPVTGTFPSPVAIPSPAPTPASALASSFGSQLQQQQALQQQFLASNLLQQQRKPETIAKSSSAQSQLSSNNTPIAQPSPANSNHSSSSGIPSGMGLGAMPSAHQSTSAAVVASSSSSSTATGSRKQSTKTRRDALANQLPLKPGRQVAFRQPKKNGEPTGAGMIGAGEWILARIETCIGADKNRYTVYDVDYDPENPTPDGGRFSTTLKSIVPLPDPRDRARTYPEHDYPKGTQVMALYPDTTSFYSARIVGNSTLEKGKAKKEKMYNVVFDEDGGKVEPVPVELVVEIPV